MITVKLFAMLKDKAGTAETVLTERPATVKELLDVIAGRSPR
jgi:molybdopterin converting factor small subunit